MSLLLNNLASRPICLLVYGVGLVGVKISLSISLFVDVVSGVFILSGFGVSWSNRNLLLTRVGEEICICVFVFSCFSGAGVFDFDISGC